MKFNLITISPYIKHMIQIQTVFSTTSTETRCVKLRNKNSHIIKGKVCLYLDLLSSSVPTSKEYKENKGICIWKGFWGKYIKMQCLSMVSGSGQHFHWEPSFIQAKNWVICHLCDEGIFYFFTSFPQARNCLCICGFFPTFMWILPVLHDHHLTNLKSFQILSENFNI